MNRRQFLVGAGTSLLCAPFVTLLGGKRALADGGKVADRLIVFFTPNGTAHDFWRPTGGGAQFSFLPGSILEPLAPHAADLVVCDGVDFVGIQTHPLGMAAMLTGGGTVNSVGAGMSVDQYIASEVKRNNRFPSLELGVQTSIMGGNSSTRMCYAAPGVFVTPEDDPRSAWKRLFADAAPDGGLDRVAARRKSVLDHLTGELADLRRRVGAEDRVRLDQHLEAVRQVEQSLTAPGASCMAPPMPNPLDLYANENFPALGRMQTDIAVTALACGMTSVVSLQYAQTAAQQVLDWAPVNANQTHHILSHMGPGTPLGVEQFVRCERWFSGEFGYLLDRLKATPDPLRGGSLFDSSLVVWCKELGDGRLHTCFSVPFVLSGGANGFLKRGQYLVSKDAPHQQLLTSLCHGMGLKNDRFGDDQFGTGPLPGVAA